MGTFVWSWGQDVDPLRRLLRRGGVLAIPTESSYALGADPRSERGVATVYAIKGRSQGKPLPVVVAGVGQLAAVGARLEPAVFAELAELWPAPLSLVLPLDEPLPASAGRGSLAVRVPAHERLRRLLDELGTPLTATSANRTGSPSICSLPELEPLLERADTGIVDGGTLPGGRPSTVVAMVAGRPEVLRAGRLPAALLEGRLAGLGIGGLGHRSDC